MGLAAEENERTGELLNESYELRDVLESGAFDDTYLARDRKRACNVRIKLLRPEYALQAKVVQNFLRQPKTLAGFEHPNVAQVLSVESDASGIPFIVEEHVEGQSLARMLEGFPNGLPLGVAMTVLAPVVDAVAAAHKRGLVHGRLHCDHVLLTKVGNTSVPKVIALGVRDVPDDDTRARLAPELRTGTSVADPRSDVWAVGALLYEALSGQAPGATAEEHVKLDECAAHLPAELSELVERCLAIGPRERPRAAGEVRDALTQVRERLRRDSDPEPSKPVPVAAAPTRQERPARAAVAPEPDVDFAFDATMMADAPPPSTVKEVNRPSLPKPPSKAPARKEDSDPELTIDAEPSTPPTPVIKKQRARRKDEDREFTLDDEDKTADESSDMMTMSDLAAAFGPMEGEENVGAAPATQQARKQEPAGRKSEKPIVPLAKGDRSSKADRPSLTKGDRPSKVDKKEPPPREKPTAPVGSPKQLRDANTPAVRTISEEQMRVLREGVQDSERRSTRVIGAIFLFAFVFALLFAIPLLYDPTRTQAQAIFGARTKLASGGLALLSVIALVRTWGMQIQQSSMLLRPVTMSLKAVTAVVCVLTAGYFLPDGALGPIERIARAALPWVSGGFFMFLGFYGLMNSMSGMGRGFMYSAGALALCAGSFFGSYRAVSSTVLEEAKRRKAAALAGSTTGTTPQLSLTGITDLTQGKLPVAPSEPEPEAPQRHSIGNSDEEDLKGIEHMRKSRQRTTGKMGEIQDAVRTMMK